MTEIGMALTNPLKGIRLPGFVGKPFPGVQIKVRNTRLASSSPACPPQLTLLSPAASHMTDYS